MVVISVPAMAWTEADLAALKAAIGSGVLQVTYDGPPRRSITYQSTESMLRVKAEMERELARESCQAPAFRRVAWRRGFDVE